jgi:hypothetical protein
MLAARSLAPLQLVPRTGRDQNVTAAASYLQLWRFDAHELSQAETGQHQQLNLFQLHLASCPEAKLAPLKPLRPCVLVNVALIVLYHMLSHTV